MRFKTILTGLLLCAGLAIRAQDDTEKIPLLPVRTINPSDIDFSDLQPIKDLIGNSRIVMLGEPDHDNGNIFEAKTRIVKYLHEELGFNLIAFESGFYDLYKANETIQQGESAKGAYFSSIFSFWSMSKEFEPLLDYMAAKKDKLKVVGFDSRFSGEHVFEYLYDDILAATSACSTPLAEGELQYWMEIVEEMAEKGQVPQVLTLTAFKMVHKHIAEAIKCNGTPDENKAFLLHLLDNIMDMAREYHNKRPTQNPGRNNNVREKLMADNLTYWTRRYPQHKIICWGTNTDFFSNTIWELSNEEAKEYRPMGSHLKKALGKDEVCFIAFTGSKTSGKNNSIEEYWKSQGAKPGIINVKDHPHPVYTSTCLNGKEEVSRNWKYGLNGLFYVGDNVKRTLQLPELGGELEASLPPTKNSQTYKRVYSNGERKKTEPRAWESIVLIGKVIDDSSQEPVAYANVNVEDGTNGTSTNSQGEFFLRITEKQSRENLKISYVGYELAQVPAKQFLKHKVVPLKALVVNIDEVVVNAKQPTAMEIMRKCIDAIPTHFNQAAFTEIRCSRSFKKFDNDSSLYLFDAVMELYDNNGFAKVPLFPVRYKGFGRLKNQRTARVDSTRHPIEAYKVKSDRSIAPWIRFEPVNNRRNCFLNKNLLRKYEFQFDGRRSENGQDYYVILFKCKNPTIRNSMHGLALSFSGEIHISANDYAPLSIVCTTIHNKKEFMTYLPKDLREKELTFYEKETFVYKKLGDFYYLDQARVNTDWLELYGESESYLMMVMPGRREKMESSLQLPDNQVYKDEDWKDLPLNLWEDQHTKR